MASPHIAGRRRALVAALVVLCSIVATGCLHGDVDVTVNSDGSGEIVVEVFPSRAMQDDLEESSVDVESLIEGAFEQVDGYDYREIEDGDRTGYRLVVPFDDYRDLQVLVDGGMVAGQQVQLFSSLNIVELPDDAGWQLDAQILPLGQAIAGANVGMIPETMQDVIDSAGIGNAGSGLDLSISLPGTIISSNASTTSGGTATWRLDEPEAPTTLQMRTEPKEFPTTVQLVVGGAGLALLLGVVLFVVGATRKHSSAKQPRTSRTRRSRERSTGRPEGNWAAPPVGTAPSPESSRPEQLPTIDAAPPAPSALVPNAPAAWQPPVGAPVDAAPPTPAGWYADPDDPSVQRWWSGTEWTDHRS